MTAAHLTDEEIDTTLEAFARNGRNQMKTAHELGISRGTLQNRLLIAERRRPQQPEIKLATPAPDPDEPLEALLARRKSGFARTDQFEKWSKLIGIDVQSDGPIAVLLVGDPHIDDDGCDVAAIERDLTIVGKTKGFHAGHIGDLTNNWVGRLARLYANQSTTFRDSLRLAEWMLGLAPNLFLINGNHDCWDHGADLLRFIVRANVHQSHGARLALRWPNGGEIRLHARHDFPGASQYSDTHGMKREILFGHRDHILVAGHRHVDEARCEPSLDGDAHWMFRISGYKIHDDYAKANGYRVKRLAPSVAVVLDPSRSVPAERVKPFWDVAAAADYLRFLRRRGS